MKVDLSGMKVLVTGASRGIGRAIAREMTRSGAAVGANYNRDRAAAESLAEGAGGQVKLLQADLSDASACADLFRRAVDVLGGVDVLVNNAGIAVSSPLDEPVESCTEAWNRTLAVNLVAAGILSREAILHFRQSGGGRIIHIASRAAFRGDTPDYLAYAASKGGMVALSRSIARGCGRDGVKSFVIAPGFTRTEMAQDFIDQYGEELAMKDVALDRLTEPQDIAPLAVFLASGLADHATGTSIDVNAGSYVR
ncbi:MAG: SDR family oxidoreductase [Candidatus Latescibacterota bacterium]|jgi:NAD(P)-dependent dehydrogenase (short-subunit alcohol dehydrogenase family)